MAQHIGIVACSAEGASLCYRTICAEGAMASDRYDHPQVSLHGHSFGDYMRCIDAGDWQGVSDLMLSSAEHLARSGADFLICPDNTVHQAFNYVEERSPLPWLHIAEVVADEAVRRGFNHVGITGTRWLTESDVYPKSLEARGLASIQPDHKDRIEMGRIIMEELVFGVFKPESIARFQGVIKKLRLVGADSVVLGCTEIPLIIGDFNSVLPTLDSTRLLARAAVMLANDA